MSIIECGFDLKCQAVCEILTREHSNEVSTDVEYTCLSILNMSMLEFGTYWRQSAAMVSKSRPVRRLIDVYEPGEGKAQVVDRPSELTNVLWRASRGDLGRRNVAITWMLFGAGMRTNEVAQLLVKDVYRPNGELKKTFIIPAKYTKTNKSRVAYIIAEHQRQALTEWQALRINERAMLSDDGSYGGLRSDSPLFLSKKGAWRKFAFNAKRYETKSGEKKEVLVCSSLENLMRDIMKGAGIQGGSSTQWAPYASYLAGPKRL